MATTTTYRQMVNRVLSSCNQPEITAAYWDQAKLEARSVKRIVAECYRDMLNQMPDEHWMREDELAMYGPVDTGMVTSIVGTDVTGDADFQATITTISAYMFPTSCYFRLVGERDWYQVASFGAGVDIILENDHLNAGVWADGKGYQLVQYRYNLEALNATFRDIVDVGRPFIGVDLTPTNVQGIKQMYGQGVDLQLRPDPTHYAIGSDEVSIPGVAGDVKFRYIWVYPIPAEDKLYTILYQRMPELLDYETSDEDEVLDLPEDMLDRMLYRAKMIARLEILGDSAGAGVYRSLEKEKQQDDASKEASKAGMNQLIPGTNAYRGFYRDARGVGSSRLWRRS